MRMLLITAALLVLAAAAPARGVTFGFDASLGTRPSGQGWTYVGTAETTIFTVASGVLAEDTIGQSTSSFFYKHALPDALPFAVVWTSRITQNENVAGTDFRFGFGLYLNSGNQLYQLGFDTTKVEFDDGHDPAQTIATLDATLDHTYRFEGTWGAGASYSLYVDGLLVASGAPVTYDGGEDVIGFGDITSGANARADLRFLTFNPPAPPVPEPSSLAVGVLGLGLLLKRRRPRS